MVVLKLRKYISKHTFNDTINFWSNRPWKNPSVGKTSEREGVLISSNLEITSAKIKSTVYLSLPRFPCLKKCLEEIHPQQPRNSCTHTAVLYGLFLH